MAKEEINKRRDDKQSDNPFSSSVPTNYNKRSNEGVKDPQSKEPNNKDHK